MEPKNSESQETSKKSSTENESIEDTILKVEAALDSSETEQEAFEKIVGSKPIEAKPELEAASKQDEPAEPEEEDEDEAELPASYKKEVRELFKKLPKEFDSLRKSVAKRERDRDKYLSQVGADTNRKTAFAQKLAQAVNPYLESWTARGITPEAGVARAAKLDSLITSDPEAAVKFVMQIAGVKRADLTAGDIEKINAAAPKSNLTESKPLTQDEIRRIVREESEGSSRFNEARQSNFQQLEALTNEKTSSGKSKYPALQDAQFVSSLQPSVVGMLAQDPSLSFQDAVIAAYYAKRGKVEVDYSKAPDLTKQRETQKLERLSRASNIRPANSSANGMNLDDIEIPDSIEDTIRLAESLANRAG